ncbi:MAG: RNA 2',3'-cyclic phosphodiesterase [Bacteroidetes bacterium]|nr:RNA 2',3'-cyclic phosphodiesterase [Bacteroidota bacterium]
MKRIFTAIDIQPSPNFLNIFYDLKSKLRDDKIKWVEIENIHITLKFFGETHEEKIQTISLALKDAASKSQPFDLTLSHVGVFGGFYKPRVVWIGIERSEELLILANNIMTNLQNIGYSGEEEFTPHLTIGRIKYITDKRYFSQVIEKQKDVFIQKSSVENIHLYESILRSEGPIYSAIKSFPLFK